MREALGMAIRFSFLVALCIFALDANGAVSSCDLTKLNFGSSQAQLKKAFNLNTVDVTTVGEGIIQVGGHDICSDLPEKSMARFVLIDDNFVQLGIVGENTSGALLAFATKTFSNQDNTKKPKKPKTALWNKNNQYSVMYNAYPEGRHNLERILITSVKHRTLFDKQNTTDDNEIDADYKANKGKGKP